MKKTNLLAGALALALAACGTPTDTAADAGTTPFDAGTPATTPIAVSGVAASHGLNQVGAVHSGHAVDFTKMVIGIVNPATVIANPDAPPLAGGALNTEAANCPGGYCAWTFPTVDIRSVTLGLVAVVDDTRPAADRLWVKTATGIASGTTLAALRASKAPIVGATAFAITKDTTAGIAAFATVIGKVITAADLEARGFLIGTVVGKKSEGYPAIAGATVSIGAETVDIIYPNATFTAPGTSTSATGTFIAIPKAAGTVIAQWTVTKPAGDARVWTAATAGTNPGGAFVLLFPAEE